MKKIVLLLLIAPFFLSSFSFDDNTCVEVKGIPMDNKDKKLDKVKISIMENGKEVKKLESKVPFKVELARDHYYSLVISKDGYLPSVIIVDTSVPKSHEECGFHIELGWNLVPQGGTYNKEYVDFPDAVVKYAKAGDEFVISEKYNTHIKKIRGANK